ncbi:ras GTPase-activating protein 3-like isoform X3 [Apostichopus japonicus]|uniref:ras GTPase-activating protein 3-like isoform X3 n=1 Tax=Stichopus japonicus TaxID=307972 RepID=UPI003AB721D2
MAGGEGPDIRILESFCIHIGEAKNLPSQRDVYASVKLDQEEIYRTAVKEKTQSPFWSEDFTFDVPREFHTLAFYVYEKDRLKRSENILGKVPFRKDELKQCEGKDRWFPLVNVDADTEVQGKVHVEIKPSDVLGEDGIVSKLSVSVLEASGLSIANGQCDPYAQVTLISPSRTETTKKTKKRKCPNPQFDETFLFEITNSNSYSEKNHFFSPAEEDFQKVEVKVSLWNGSSNVFMGEVKIPMSAIVSSESGNHNAWYYLQPREGSNHKSQRPAECSSLRVRVSYEVDSVFPSEHYAPLLDVLLGSPQVEPVTSSPVLILDQCVKDKAIAASSITRIFHHKGEIIPLVRGLIKNEVSKITNPNTIFRGNSLTTKVIDEYMHMEGLYYLHKTLKELIEEILEERKPCEIDSAKFRDGENLAVNLNNVMEYVGRAYRAIINSAMACPTSLCEVFCVLREVTDKQFPDQPDVKYAAVSAFIFLRLFAPAILSPRLFQLCQDNPDETVSRTLKIVSKAIQTLGNHVNPDKVNSYAFKEVYMLPLFKSLLDREHILSIRKFLEIVSTCTKVPPKSPESAVTLKEGYLTKRAQGRKKYFGVKNFKKRWFRLTNHELTYGKCKETEPLCTIPVSEILAVEKLQEDSFHMKFMFQVVQPERALYVQGSNCVEEKEWMDILSKVCQSNKNRLRYFHPAAYVNGQWICCNAAPETERGCTPVTSGLPVSVIVAVDPDRELERIYRLFHANSATLKKLQESCAILAVYQGNQEQVEPIEDDMSCFTSVKAILNSIDKLTKEHEDCLKRRREQMEPGSKQSPIGDPKGDDFQAHS